MWPSMDIVLNEANAHTTVKDLDFRFTSMHMKFSLLNLLDQGEKK
jgi:hypothetical protein